MACWVLRLDRKSPPFHLALAYFWDIVPYNAKKRKGQKKALCAFPRREAALSCLERVDRA